MKKTTPAPLNGTLTASIKKHAPDRLPSSPAEFTGISSPYEKPENPELAVSTGTDELETCVQQVLGEMSLRGIIRPAPCP
ncbi:MAG: adenylyl-sulfate kinase [Gallionella sp.]|nr:adenylyl-sulfate kinase [Gallionella sp.]